MLELRPSCENCATPLPPDSVEAMICSFECTFCRSCVEKFSHTCPNCGGGFEARPIRPVNNWRNGNYLGNHPPTSKVTYKPVDFEAHAEMLEAIGHTPTRLR